MKEHSYHLERFNTIPKEYEEILYHESVITPLKQKDCPLFAPLASSSKMTKAKSLEELLERYFMVLFMSILYG